MLTPAERRGALVVLALIALGTAWDLWHASHPRWRPLAQAVDRVTATTDANDRDSLNHAAGDRDVTGRPSAAGSRDSVPVARPAGRGKRPPSHAIDLNHAGPEEFHALPGIGPVLAKRIVDYRSAHGPFGSVEELRAVRGIGPKLFERLRPYVRV
ncbi:MAG TPA: helix-hairpin-helix domain-containing protein [Candidatus Udaeobacter sp.]|jgi:competence protein ComEA|nr:helix-hairpin-helix domain-containing protein [Candidatus Udaeobacter sp.]